MSQRSIPRRWPTVALRVVTLAALLVAFAPDAAHPAPPTPKTITIAAARRLPLGTVVTIDGSITVPSGAFSSSTFDQGFAIQDRTGGIYVSVDDDPGLAPRRQARVTGRLDELFGLLILGNVADIKPHGSGPKVRALPLATGDVGAASEGMLVRVTGTITRPTQDDLPFGRIVFVDDGSGEVQVFVCVSTGIDVSGLSPGQTIDVTGFSGQFDGTIEVEPRFQSDITVLP